MLEEKIQVRTGYLGVCIESVLLGNGFPKLMVENWSFIMVAEHEIAIMARPVKLYF